MIVIAWIVFLAIVAMVTYRRCRPAIWLPTLIVVLCLYSIFEFMDIVSLSILWVLVLLSGLLVTIAPLRKRVLTQWIMRWFKAQQPPISPSEQVVLDAGGTWWETEIFSGKPNWSALRATKITELTPTEQAFLDQQVTTLCSMLNEWTINNKDKDLPREAWDYIKQQRFWGICIDQHYGGLGFSHAAHSAIVVKIASCSISAAYTVMVPNSLGPAELIDYCGTEQQKQHYLPRLARGEEIGCFGLTSLYAGSDAASIPDRGVVCKGTHNDQEVLGIRLNFKKRYITLAPVATLIGCAFRLFDPEHLLGSNEDVGITVALVPYDQPGVERGRRHSPLTLGFMNGPVSGTNVFIPIDWVIGGKEKCGDGWEILVGCLSVGRGISMPALATAVAQQCYSLTGAYAYVRQQFKRNIGDFEGIQEALGQVGGLSYLIEANRYVTTQAVVDGARPSVAAAIVKYHMTQLSRRLLQTAMDIHSGHALQAGPSNILAEVYAGIPVSTVGEGANIMTRNLIIFGQGVLRAHPYIRQEIMAAVNNDDLNSFDSLFMQHLGFSLSLACRGKVYGFSNARFIATPNSPLRRYYQRIQQFSNALVLMSDVALAVLGKDLKIKEFLSARLGDILSYLYLATAVLKYAFDHNESEADLPYAEWALSYCLYHCAQTFKQVFSNFPKRTLAALLRGVLFPWGLDCPYPRDELNIAIARDMQTDSGLRQRLTKLCYVGPAENDPIGRVTRAWQVLLKLEPIYHKIHKALKQKNLKRQLTLRETLQEALSCHIVTEEECQQLMDAEKMRDRAMNVDEFAFDDLIRFNAERLKQVHID